MPDTVYHVCRLRIFELFPVLLAIAVTWVYAIIVTEAGAYDKYAPTDDTTLPDNFYQFCRTDQSSVLKDSPWIRWPYPGQWGGPIFTWSAVLTMLAGALSAMVESVCALPVLACSCAYSSVHPCAQLLAYISPMQGVREVVHLSYWRLPGRHVHHMCCSDPHGPAGWRFIATLTAWSAPCVMHQHA